jgi:hypothetical protein
MKVSKKLLWQQGAAALFAEIEIDVERSNGAGIEIRCPDSIQPQWSNAISFAANLFTESFAWREPMVAQIDVSILSISAVPGDTTLCSLAYVAFHALCFASNVDGEQVFAFDRSSGAFSIGLPGLVQTL